MASGKGHGSAVSSYDWIKLNEVKQWKTYKSRVIFVFYSDMKLMTKYEVNKIRLLIVSKIWTRRTDERAGWIPFGQD